MKLLVTLEFSNERRAERPLTHVAGAMVCHSAACVLSLACRRPCRRQSCAQVDVQMRNHSRYTFNTKKDC